MKHPRWLPPEDWRHGGFGLYVHWPFCAAKCPYCDFNSHVVASVDHVAWRNALVTEVRAAARLVPDRVLSTIFFGGGTPSLMPPSTVAAIITAASEAWPIANDIEITLEANPTSVETDRFVAYREAGVTRVSLGVQALRDPDLRKLGRLHSVREALAALETAKDVFDRVSVDVIYARQFQTADDWRAELGEILAFAPEHLSLYQLTIEPGTAFGERFARGKLGGLPDEDLGADLYELTQSLCVDAGMAQYEISNHARPGAEAKHNLIYWRYGDYVGIGPGAHGRLTVDGARYATETATAPAQWLSSVERTGTAMRQPRNLPLTEQADEMVMMGLRLREGISLARYEALAGKPMDPGAIGRLVDLGLVALTDDVLMCTPKGRPLLNPILAELLAAQTEPVQTRACS